MRARCPSSTSNLGPGFDVLSLALNLYVEVEAHAADHLSIESEGEGSAFAGDASHLCARVANAVFGHDRFSFRVRSEIPVGRGLGSSAALAVATAAAIGALDPFAVATKFDGHAENAAASVFGGLNAATIVDGSPVAARLPLDEQLCFVALVPDNELSTEHARSVLPAQVGFADAVTNLGRMGLLLAGLYDRRQLFPAAGVDRLHQDVRTALFPQAPALLKALIDAGASMSCWSGAGPTLLGICDGQDLADKVCLAGEKALRDQGVAGTAMRLVPDVVGLVTSD